MHVSNITAAAVSGANFTIDRKAIADAVAELARIVERRNTIPILGHIMLAAHPAGYVELTATDLDRALSVRLAAAVESPGVFCADAFALRDLLRKTDKSRDELRMTYADGKALIKCGRMAAKVNTLPADDFPIMARGEGPAPLSWQSDAAPLSDELACLAPAICKEETRYYLRGIYVERIAGTMMLAATDGHIASKIERESDGPDYAGGIIPAANVETIRRMAKHGEPVAIEMHETRGAATAGDWTLIFKLVDGTFPDVRRVFPSACAASLAVQSSELLDHCKAAAVRGTRRQRPLVLEMSGEGLRAGQSGDNGHARPLSGEYRGEALAISFDAAKVEPLAKLAPSLLLQFVDHEGPFLLTSPDVADWSVAVMPMRGDGELPRERAVEYHETKAAPGCAGDLFGIERMDKGNYHASWGGSRPGPRKATDRECMAYLADYAARCGLPDLDGKRLIMRDGIPVGLVIGEIREESVLPFDQWEIVDGIKRTTYLPAEYADGAYSIPMPGRNQAPITMQTQADDGSWSAPMPCTDAKGNIALPNARKAKKCSTSRAKASVCSQNDGGFQRRVDFACSVIASKGERTRRFSSCFENGDGAAVVAAIVRRASQNPQIAENMPRYLCADYISESEAIHADKDLAAWAKELREGSPQCDAESDQADCATTPAPAPEIAPQPPEIAPSEAVDADADPLAALNARLDAAETALTEKPRIRLKAVAVPIEPDADAPLPVENQESTVVAWPGARAWHAERDQAERDRAARERSRRERIVRAYLKMRAERAEIIADLNMQTTRANRERDKRRDAVLRSGQWREKFKKAELASFGWESRVQQERQIAAADHRKRRRAVLKARELQQRLNAEYRLVDQARTQARDAQAKWRDALAAVEQAKVDQGRLAAALECRDAAVREQDAARKQLAEYRAKAAAQYDRACTERDTAKRLLESARADLASVTRERDAQANAINALAARIERIEAAAAPAMRAA